MGAMCLSRLSESPAAPVRSIRAQMTCKQHSARVSRLESGYLDGQVLGRVSFWVAYGCDLSVFARG